MCITQPYAPDTMLPLPYCYSVAAALCVAAAAVATAVAVMYIYGLPLSYVYTKIHKLYATEDVPWALYRLQELTHGQALTYDCVRHQFCSELYESCSAAKCATHPEEQTE
jgi:hypothetical protein